MSGPQQSGQQSAQNPPRTRDAAPMNVKASAVEPAPMTLEQSKTASAYTIAACTTLLVKGARRVVEPGDVIARVDLTQETIDELLAHGWATPTAAPAPGVS